MKGDLAEARVWYERARKLGSQAGLSGCALEIRLDLFHLFAQFLPSDRKHFQAQIANIRHSKRHVVENGSIDKEGNNNRRAPGAIERWNL